MWHHLRDLAAPGWRRVAPASVLLFALLAVVSASVLGTRRELAHLASWSVTETTSRATLDESPALESGSPHSDDELMRARVVARQVLVLCDQPPTRPPVRWASVVDMVSQIRAGAYADCWPRSIVFASDARSAGFPARLWALEGAHFAGVPHTVPEVYLAGVRRWVMLDVTLNAYARDASGAPLGVLDLRDRLLGGGSDSLELVPIGGATLARPDTLLSFYRDRLRGAFLRTGDVLEDRGRYGVLASLAPSLDRLPEGAKKLVSATLGSTGRVLYYHDSHNGSLGGAAWMAKLWLWALLLSLIGLDAHIAFLAAYVVRNRPPAGPWSFADDFSSGDLRRFEHVGMRQISRADSMQIVAAPQGDGRRVLGVRLAASDPPVRGGHRSELRFPSTRFGTMNHYAFSIFVPGDWKGDRHETILAQWHSVPDRWLGEYYLPSPLQLSVVDGCWRLFSAWDARPVIRFLIGSGEPRGGARLLSLPIEWDRWVAWSFRVRWAHDDSGLIEVWKDGVGVARRRGPNAYNDAIGPYFKFGQYWIAPDGALPATSRVAYFDQVRLHQGVREA